MASTVPFGLRRLKPYLVADADQLPQRLNVESGFAQENLQFAAAQIVNAIRSLKKLLDDVLAHGSNLRNWSLSS